MDDNKIRNSSISIISSDRDMEIFNLLKQEYELKIEELIKEKEDLINSFGVTEGKYKVMISNLENELEKKENDIYILEIEKQEMENEYSNKINTEETYFSTISEYSSKIKKIEELKERKESAFKKKISIFTKEVEENDKILSKIKNDLEIKENENINLKSELAYYTLLDKQYKESLNEKDKIINNLNTRIELVHKDCCLLKQENERMKKENQEIKKNHFDYIEQAGKQKEFYHSQLSSLEDKISYYETLIEKKQKDDLININKEETNYLSLEQLEQIDYNIEDQLNNEIKILKSQINLLNEDLKYIEMIAINSRVNHANYVFENEEIVINLIHIIKYLLYRMNIEIDNTLNFKNLQLNDIKILVQ